jgi:hypothetical protein
VADNISSQPNKDRCAVYLLSYVYDNNFYSDQQKYVLLNCIKFRSLNDSANCIIFVYFFPVLLLSAALYGHICVRWGQLPVSAPKWQHMASQDQGYDDMIKEMHLFLEYYPFFVAIAPANKL